MFVEIRKALETQLATMSGLPVVAWENVASNPVANVPYLKSVFIPTANPQVTIGGNGITNPKGLLVVTLAFPANTGPHAADVMADKILALFKAGSAFVQDGIRVMINKSERTGSSQNDGVWYEFPVVVSWKAYVSQ